MVRPFKVRKWLIVAIWRGMPQENIRLEKRMICGVEMPEGLH